MTQPFYIFTFLRHGESVGNAESRWQGQADFPLTEKGRAQAQALASRWTLSGEAFNAIISSPLARAFETAQIIGSALRLEVQPDALWMERAIGEFSGLTTDEVDSIQPQRNFITPFDPVGGDGEGDWELFLRAGRALHNILQRPAGKYLIVSHGGILNLVMHAVIGITPHANSGGPRFRFQNTAFARATYYPQSHRWNIDAVNDRAHWNKNDE